MNKQKLLVVGLDGADKEALIDGINRGKTPNISEIAQEGAISTLKAPVPPVTPVSMASALTGEGPAEHGIYGFEETGEYVDYTDIDSDTLFDRLQDENLDIIPVNVPMTSPLPESIDLGVSGFPITDSEFAKPYPVREKLREIDYQVEPSDFKGEEKEFVDEVFDLAQKRFRLSLDLLENDWDVFFLMFTGDARLQHFIDDRETVTDFYEQVDQYIGRLLDEIDEDVEVLIFSDHGFSDLEVRFDIGEWLAQQGYMEENPGSDTSKLYGEMVGTPDAKAYPAGAYLGGVYADEDIRDEIVEKLEGLEHDGRKVFRDVLLSEELYGDSGGPDIVPVPRRGFSHVAGYSDEIFDEEPSEKRVPDTEGVLISSKDIGLDKLRSEDLSKLIFDHLGI